MTPQDDGGPAFPTENFDNMMRERPVGFRGMSLRDYFAAQALAGHLASLAPGSWGSDTPLAKDAAQGAYLVADAMIAQRNK